MELKSNICPNKDDFKTLALIFNLWLLPDIILLYLSIVNSSVDVLKGRVDSSIFVQTITCCRPRINETAKEAAVFSLSACIFVNWGGEPQRSTVQVDLDGRPRRSTVVVRGINPGLALTQNIC